MLNQLQPISALCQSPGGFPSLFIASCLPQTLQERRPNKNAKKGYSERKTLKERCQNRNVKKRYSERETLKERRPKRDIKRILRTETLQERTLQEGLPVGIVLKVAIVVFRHRFRESFSLQVVSE